MCSSCVLSLPCMHVVACSAVLGSLLFGCFLLATSAENRTATACVCHACSPSLFALLPFPILLLFVSSTIGDQGTERNETDGQSGALRDTGPEARIQLQTSDPRGIEERWQPHASSGSCPTFCSAASETKLSVAHPRSRTWENWKERPTNARCMH